VNFLARKELPFPVVKTVESTSWTHNRIADEYAASPVDVIRSFLSHQRQVYQNQNQWTNFFIIDPLDFYRHNSAIAGLAVVSPLYFTFDPSPKPLDWRPQPFDSPEITFVSLDDPNMDHQLVFPLQEGFAPSKQLLDLWESCVRAYAADAQVGMPAAATELELRQQFSNVLRSVFGTVAQQIRYEESDDFYITRNDRFTPRLQLEISEQFLIGGYEAGRFFNLLGQELGQAISTGTRIAGAWGEVVRSHTGDLVYRLRKPNKITQDGFLAASRVE
jgi:hypothetical protein